MMKLYDFQGRKRNDGFDNYGAFYNLAYGQRTLDPSNIRGDLWRNR